MKKSRKGIILFFCLYAALVGLILFGLFQMMTPLGQKLTAYEAAQLENKSAQVFEELFARPDWKKIYELSGTADTPYEGAEAYAAHMEAKVGNGLLTYQQAYTEFSEVRKYDIFFGNERIAAFTMTGGAGSSQELPRWTLAGVELFFERTVSVTVEKKPEHTVYINGVALDDSFTIRTVATEAERYLPEGVHGYRLEQQYIDGLLIQPEVLVLDEKGEAVPVMPDGETGIYTLPSGIAEMTEAEREVAKNAAIADAKFSMGGLTAGELRQYFDAETQVYADIVNNPIFVQKNNGFSVDEKAIEVGQFCRYSDDLFSANVKLTVKVTRKDHTVKVYPLDKTYFFTRSGGEQYLVSDYTNQPVQETVEQVRLTFAADERICVMVDSDADMVSVPEMGGQLVGWATKTDDGSGTITMTVRLMPDGTVLGELEPMTLYPVYRTMLENSGETQK